MFLNLHMAELIQYAESNFIIRKHFNFFFWDSQASLTSSSPPSARKRAKPADKLKTQNVHFSRHKLPSYKMSPSESWNSLMTSWRPSGNLDSSQVRIPNSSSGFSFPSQSLSNVLGYRMKTSTHKKIAWISLKKHLNASRSASPFGWESFLSSVAIILRNSLNSIEQFFSSELNPFTSSVTSLP